MYQSVPRNEDVLTLVDRESRRAQAHAPSDRPGQLCSTYSSLRVTETSPSCVTYKLYRSPAGENDLAPRRNLERDTAQITTHNRDNTPHQHRPWSAAARRARPPICFLEAKPGE
jgi:hypothetical protein